MKENKSHDITNFFLLNANIFALVKTFYLCVFNCLIIHFFYFKVEHCEIFLKSDFIDKKFKTILVGDIFFLNKLLLLMSLWWQSIKKMKKLYKFNSMLELRIKKLLSYNNKLN